MKGGPCCSRDEGKPAILLYAWGCRNICTVKLSLSYAAAGEGNVNLRFFSLSFLLSVCLLVADDLQDGCMDAWIDLAPFTALSAANSLKAGKAGNICSRHLFLEGRHGRSSLCATAQLGVWRGVNPLLQHKPHPLVQCARTSLMVAVTARNSYCCV